MSWREQDASESYMDLCVDRLRKAGVPQTYWSRVTDYAGCTASELRALTDLTIAEYRQDTN